MPFELPSLLRVTAFVTVVGSFIQAGAAWAADGQEAARAIAAKLGHPEDDQAILATSKIWPADPRVELLKRASWAQASPPAPRPTRVLRR